jgi:pimeloyl-ACP methyl ester carboxylesterase
MTSYVLVGGAWIGAWAWRDVARVLRDGGHDVYTPSLTGLAERVHLGGPETDLETHITDVVNVLTYDDLRDVVLVGHSYAGIVVSGVADRAAERLHTLVFCDSGPLPNGACFLDPSPPDQQAATRRAVDERGNGWRLPFPGFPLLGEQASLSGLGPEQQRLMERRATPHPFGTYTQRLRLERDGVPPYQRAMILCQDGRKFLEFARARLVAGDPTFQAMAGDDWKMLELDTGHWPMLSRPAELGELLRQLA